MTLRGVALLFAPLPLLAAGARVGVLLWIGVAAFVGAVAAVAVDGRRAPGQARIRALRDHPDLLSVGRPGHVRLRLDVAGGAAEATVRDEHPLGMRIGTVVDTSGINAEPAGPAPEAVGRAPGPAPEAVVVRTRIPATVVYSVTPPARGRGEFGRTTVRAEGPWRLGFRQATVGEPTTVRVDPDLSALSVYEALARRGQLAELGVRSLRNPGEGTEFERIRDAVPDDPMRSINWKATARTGRLMAAELIPERSQPVVVCLDHGRLMGVGAGPLTKLDCAINAALLLVHVALRAGDRAGLLSFSDHVTVALPPRAGRAQLRAFLDAVEPLAPGVAEADYDEALA